VAWAWLAITLLSGSDSVAVAFSGSANAAAALSGSASAAAALSGSRTLPLSGSEATDAGAGAGLSLLKGSTVCNCFTEI